MENAIQATPPDGLVTVKLTVTGNDAQIQIVDTGSGIAREAIPTLFEQFKSIGDINNRKMGGLGLGLFIAKSLVQGHGGSILVESSIGQGTVMTITLPKQNPTTA